VPEVGGEARDVRPRLGDVIPACTQLTLERRDA
jgi:hypothetical protein